MADKTVLIELSVEGKNALSKVNELTNSLKTLEKGTDEYKQAVKELTEQEKILTKAQKARDKAQKESSKQMKQVKTDTGAATSATLELGRVFSDMPYGIRGVANNLQQLAANLFFMSKKTDATTGKLKGSGS
jgi:regulator of replication initiation timing